MCESKTGLVIGRTMADELILGGRQPKPQYGDTGLVTALLLCLPASSIGMVPQLPLASEEEALNMHKHSLACLVLVVESANHSRVYRSTYDLVSTRYKLQRHCDINTNNIHRL